MAGAEGKDRELLMVSRYHQMQAGVKQLFSASVGKAAPQTSLARGYPHRVSMNDVFLCKMWWPVLKLVWNKYNLILHSDEKDSPSSLVLLVVYSF